MNDKSESVRKNTERSDMNDRFLSLPGTICLKQIEYNFYSILYYRNILL